MAIQHLRPQGVELEAFSHVVADPSLSEEKWIDLIARTSGARVHKVTPEGKDLLRDIKEVVRTQDEPFVSTSIYAQYRVFRLAQENGIKVMLDGQGADEMLAGYPPYLAGRVATLIVRGQWLRGLRALWRIARLPGIDPRAIAIRVGGLLIPGWMEGQARRLAGESFFPAWMDRSWALRHSISPSPFRVAAEGSPLRAQLREALFKRSLPSLLRYEDRNSMASSVESRVPFLTKEIAELVFSLPEEYIIDETGTTKSVFRQAMRNIVPDPILDRRDKVGFATSESTWLRSLRPALQGILEGPTARAIPALNHDLVRAEAEAVLNGRKRFDSRLWRWLSVIWWAEQYSVEFEH